MDNNQASNIIDSLKKIGKGGAALAAIGILTVASFSYNDSGVSTRLQQPGLGFKWIKEEGFYGHIPFLSKKKSYNQTGTIAQSDNDSIVDTASLTAQPRNLQFADSYEMHLEWTMRYEIPKSDEALESMHKKVKSEENLLGNTVMPFAQTLVNDSVNQMLGEQFAQGGRNTLRTLIDDQSQYGMYQTKVEKVETGRGKGKGSNDVTGGADSQKLTVTKVVYLKDGNGKKLRTPLGLSQYGIKIVPNSIAVIDAVPQGRLVEYIETKQKNLKLQIEQDEKQKILAKETHTAKLQGEKDLVTRTNRLNIEKQEAIIAAERRVEEATLQAEKETVERQKVADLAIIDKKRELQIAQDNEGIQKANAAAAKYEADAIKEVGFAEAAVTQAKYKAIDPKILAMEVDKAKALALYSTDMKVEMPTFYQQGGAGAGTGTDSNVELMSTLKVLESLGKTNGQ